MDLVYAASDRGACHLRATFYRDLYPWDVLCEILLVVTGIQANNDVLRKRAAAISTLVRQFKLRQGLTPEDDWLPKRLFQEMEKAGHII